MIAGPSEKPAVAYQGKEISYRQLHENILRYREAYSLPPASRAVIFSENRPEWIFAFYSVWANQGIPVTVDIFSNADDVAHILRDCRPALVFHSDKSKAVLDEAVQKSGHTPETICLDRFEPPAARQSRLEFQARPDDTAVIIYTSGTTGSPKGVMLSHTNLQAVQKGYIEEKYFLESDRIIAILPFHHILPLQGSVLIPLRVGAMSVLVDRLDSEAIVSALQKYHITLFIGVPRLYRMLLDGILGKIRKNRVALVLYHLSRSIGSYALGKKLFKKVQDGFGGQIRYMVSGGSFLDPEILKGFRALGFKVLNGYGLTETSPSLSNNAPDDIRIGSVGRLFPGVEIRIVDDEITARGPNIMQGYYNNPEATRAVLRDGWFHTGDKGQLDKKGYLYVTGRIKEIIVLSNGKKINPEEVERQILTAHPLLKEIGVYQQGDSLGAILVPDLAHAMKSQIVNLQETLRWTVIDTYNRGVPSYRKIRSMTVVRNELPKTKLGKIRRFLLPGLAEQAAAGHAAPQEPDMEEFRLIRTFLEETGKTGIQAHQHLELDLGLDSLDKVEFLVFIERTFGIQLAESKLAEFPSLLSLCQYLQKTKVQVGTESINWKEILKEEINLTLPKRIVILTLFKWVFKPLSKLYFRFEVKGLENIPAHAPCIIAPNHQSYMDTLILASSLKGSIMRKTYFFAKEKHFRSAFRRFVAQNSHVIVMNINSGLKNAIQQTAAVLKNGKNMVIFPEGARSRDGGLMPFKKTFAILSKELNVPIIPVAIKGAYQSLSVGSRFPRPGKITLEFLAPLYPGDHDYDSLARHTQDTIQNSLCPSAS